MSPSAVGGLSSPSPAAGGREPVLSRSPDPEPVEGEGAAEGAYDIIVVGPGAGEFPELIAGFWVSVSTNPTAIVRHDDQVIDDLFRRVTSSVDFQERVTLSREIERRLVRDQVYAIFNWYTYAVAPYRSALKGIPDPKGTSATNYLDHALTWLDR